MARLPTPGSDNEVWDDLLNEWARVEHNDDGTHKGGRSDTLVNEDVTGTTYTLALADIGKRKSTTNASPVTISVPENVAVAWPVNKLVEVYQRGDGLITFAGVGAAVVRSFGGSLTSAGKYAGFRLTKLATNEWLLEGMLA